MARAKAVEMTAELSANLWEWQQAATQLEAIKQKEMALRVKLVAAMCSASKLEGSETLDIGNGYKVKACKHQNYSLTNLQGETARFLDAIGAVDPALAMGFCKWTPEMSKTGYNAVIKVVPTLPGLDALLAAALTIKPGAPTIEIIAPS